MKIIWQHLQRAWKAWTRIARIIGNFQARVILSVFYLIFGLPFGAAIRLFADPLRIKTRPSHWIEYPSENQDLDWAHRQ